MRIVITGDSAIAPRASPTRHKPHRIGRHMCCRWVTGQPLTGDVPVQWLPGGKCLAGVPARRKSVSSHMPVAMTPVAPLAMVSTGMAR